MDAVLQTDVGKRQLRDLVDSHAAVQADKGQPVHVGTLLTTLRVRCWVEQRAQLIVREHAPVDAL